MHLGRVEGHRQHAIGTGGRQEIGDEATADRDPRRILLIGARIGIVRHHGGDSRGGGPTRGVEHEEEFHQVFLDRWNKRLDEEDIALAAIRVQLRLETVIAEAIDRCRVEG